MIRSNDSDWRLPVVAGACNAPKTLVLPFRDRLRVTGARWRVPLRELQVWMIENLRENLSVERLAKRMGMSSRNFTRVCLRECE
jgi:transcriptional regulator GlxA family with amidase domain